jgi:prepilin-type processing-associated H-X9-DG protein
MDAKDSESSSDAAGGKSPAPLEYASPGIKPVRRGRPLTVAALIIVSILLLLSIFIPAPSRPSVVANRIKSASNLRQIGVAITLYSQSNQGAYPPTFVELWESEDLTPGVFVAPADTANTPSQGATTQAIANDLIHGAHCSYVYLGQGLNTLNPISPDVVICFEPLSVNAGAGMEVLFADGHVDWLDAKAGNAIMAQFGIGNRPVRWPIPAATMPGN